MKTHFATRSILTLNLLYALSKLFLGKFLLSKMTQRDLNFFPEFTFKGQALSELFFENFCSKSRQGQRIKTCWSSLFHCDLRISFRAYLDDRWWPFLSEVLYTCFDTAATFFLPLSLLNLTSIGLIRHDRVFETFFRKCSDHPLLPPRDIILGPRQVSLKFSSLWQQNL